jgi:hypothetical protein
MQSFTICQDHMQKSDGGGHCGTNEAEPATAVASEHEGASSASSMRQ